MPHCYYTKILQTIGKRMSGISLNQDIAVIAEEWDRDEAILGRFLKKKVTLY